jgi:hypothetical protein
MMKKVVVPYKPSETYIVPQHSSDVQYTKDVEKEFEIGFRKQKREKDAHALQWTFQEVRDVRIHVAQRFRVYRMVVLMDPCITVLGVQQSMRQVKPQIVRNNEGAYFEYKHLS